MLYKCVSEEPQAVVPVETRGYAALTCPPPLHGFDLPHKGCRVDGDTSSCVAGNAHYSSLGGAWEACGKFQECSYIMRYTNGLYYLRRSGDRDEPIAGAATMPYRCETEVRHTGALTCSPPTSSFDLPHRGCGTDGDTSSCVAGNAHFSSLSAAWEACGEHPSCSYIMHFTDGNYYLRRSSDREEPIAGAASMRYRCETKVVPTRPALTCPPPTSGFDLPHKGCAVDGDESSCVANNAHYSSLQEAWDMCGRFPECSYITRWTDNEYYLRRSSDPDEPVAGSASIRYRCQTVAVQTKTFKQKPDCEVHAQCADSDITADDHSD